MNQVTLWIDLTKEQWEMAIRELGYRLDYGHPEDEQKLRLIIKQLRKGLDDALLIGKVSR